jgi:transcriptional regulator with XRE-family HTH domain
MTPEDEARIETYRWIGLRLRWARELVYPTQAAFARALNLDKHALAKIEHGKRPLRLVNLITAANKLRTGTEYLLTGNLAGVEPELQRLLMQRHPELLQMPPPLARASRDRWPPIQPSAEDERNPYPVPPRDDKDIAHRAPE